MKTALLEIDNQAVPEQAIEQKHAPWEDNPYGVVSLLTMLSINAAAFCRLAARLATLESLARSAPDSQLTPASVDVFLTREINPLVEDFRLLELEGPHIYLLRMKDRLETKASMSNQEFAEMSTQLRERVEDELEATLIFKIPKGKASYFRSKEPLFGATVFVHFHPANDDIEQAGKCYALGRNTAVVFHLMRVMEVGLRALGKSLNDPSLNPSLNPSWEMILRKCDRELALDVGKRCLEWRSDDLFFSSATANLRAVKNAWRNPTMHVERNYDDEEALDVMNAVKGFMKHLATKLMM
jgi:hypothetical protein